MKVKHELGVAESVCRLTTDWGTRIWLLAKEKVYSSTLWVQTLSAAHSDFCTMGTDVGAMHLMGLCTNISPLHPTPNTFVSFFAILNMLRISVNIIIIIIRKFWRNFYYTVFLGLLRIFVRYTFEFFNRCVCHYWISNFTLFLVTCIIMLTLCP
jgi:hypothetical protein